MNFSDKENLKKLTTFVNIVIMIFVLGMGLLFAKYHVNYMVWHSIPTFALYIVMFWVIKKDLLHIYLWTVYTMIIVYMTAATICLGYNYGFHLYCMSMIPIIFFTEYMAYKINGQNPRSLIICIIIAACYIGSNAHVILNGPVYQINNQSAVVLLGINSMAVFFFLIFYTRVMVKMIISSEEKLTQMAHVDRLTGIYNRHYMITFLEKLANQQNKEQWLAMIDLDNFKNINDTYGHDCGDYVLVHVCELMKENCPECTICRWGGEEFLIYGGQVKSDIDLLETLREAVANFDFEYQGKKIDVTITIGVAAYRRGDKWEKTIKEADEKLYEGKTHGKNQVVR